MAEFKNWDYHFYDVLGSTNDEAQKYCSVSSQRNIIRAKIQTSGRGRRGRQWISESGNLFFSLVFEFEIKNIGALVLISALSLAQTIEKFNSKADIKLKWPNDVLLNNKKVSGILLEKAKENYIIVGIGVNIVSAPQNNELIYQATSLKQNAINCTADDFLHNFITQFDKNLEQIERKTQLKDEWLKRAAGINKKITVKQETAEETGIFYGIDENMCLLLKKDDKIKKILVGDVFFTEE